MQNDKPKLFKATVEYTFVFAAKDSKDAEASVKDIMGTHGGEIIMDGFEHHHIDPINDEGDLPAGWAPRCLPWTKYTYLNMPEELVNKTIKDLL